MHNKKAGFTLMELLIMIGVISVLTVAILFTLKPARLLKQARDAKRLTEMASLHKALDLYTSSGGTSLGTSTILYISLVDWLATSTAGTNCAGVTLPALPTGTTAYHCAASSTRAKVDGTGWLPVNISRVSLPISSLPIDPSNTTSSALYYVYATQNGQWEFNTVLESDKYIPNQTTDGGNNSAKYEYGSNLSIIP